MSLIVRINTLYPQAGDKLWITVDRARFFVGNLLRALSPFNSLRGLHSPAHSFKVLSHSFKFLNKRFEQGFYRFSTVLPASYYYYLYIYKSRFQADQPQIKVLQNNIYMSARTTA